MAIRRDLFLAMGGFDERLYPNEENELLDRIESKGLQILHDPDLAVQRSQRSTIGAFIRQMFNYGKGRAQQTKISRRFSIISFIPLFFVCYIFLLPIALLTQHQVWLLPILSYVAISLVFTVDAIINFRSPFACTLLLLYPIMHTANGFGLLFGLIFKVKNDSSGSMESPVFLRKSSVTKQMDFLRNNQTTEK